MTASLDGADASIVIATDSGGTSTRSVVLRGDGTCLGFGRSGSGNPISAGLGPAARSAADSARTALAAAGVEPREVDTWLMAMAGSVAERDLGAFSEPMRELGVAAPLRYRGDALALFFSGTWEPDGYALIVGTGAVAVRIEAGEVAAVSDGLGWLLGDVGSGFWLGHQVALAALAGPEGRGPQTLLTGLMMAELGIEPHLARGPDGRIELAARTAELIYQGRPVELARFARLAFQATGDAVAEQIVDNAAAALARTLGSVWEPGVAGPVVLGGGVLAANPGFAGRIVAAQPAGVPPRVRLVVDGLPGAALLALAATGRPAGEHAFRRIAQGMLTLGVHGR